MKEISSVRARAPRGRGLNAALLFPVLYALAFLFGAQADAATRENRVLFNEDFAWITRAGADRLLDRMKQAGFNVLVPCVWHGGGVSWPSTVAEPEPRWTKRRDPQNPDPLGYLITKAHQRGIQVHAWFTIGLRRPDFLPQLADPGTPDKAFDLHKPEARDLIVRVIMDAVRKYPLDGVNLDYARTLGVCVSDSCAADYARETGRNLRVDQVTSRFDSAAAAGIAGWQRNVTSDVVRRVHDEVTKVKPGILLSVDSVVGIWSEQGAGSIYWANQGWVDLIYHMDYHPPETVNRALLAQGRETIDDPKKLVLLIGNFDNPPLKGLQPPPRDAAKVVALVDLVRQLTPEAKTVPLYTYEALTDAQIQALRSGPFATPAEPAWPFQSGGKAP